MNSSQISEKDFTEQVLDAARIFGWRTAHFRPARTLHGWRTPVSGDGQGFPDLILLRGDVELVAELKVPKTKAVQAVWRHTPTTWRRRVAAWRSADCEKDLFDPAQIEWLEAYDATAWSVYVWCPVDLDEIIRILK